MKHKLQPSVFKKCIDGQYVLVSLRGSGAPPIIPLNETANFYIDRICAGDSVKEMLHAAAARYGVPVAALKPGLMLFLQQLVQEGVLTACRE